MKNRLAIKCLLIAVSLFIISCDKGKKPYEEAEVLLNKSDYSGAKAKAIEVVQNAPKSKYLTQAKTLYLKVENIENLFNAAAEALQADDYKKAIKDYEGILALDSKSPKATEELEKVKGTYKSKLMQEGKAFVESGKYEKGIESYREILTFVGNAKEAMGALKDVEATFSNLKQTGDEIMRHFRVMMQTWLTSNFQAAETARVRCVALAKGLCATPGGRAYLSVKLMEYIKEVESSLNSFLSKAKALERASSYERQVLAADEYDRALVGFIENYGRPEPWIKEVMPHNKNETVKTWIQYRFQCQ